MFTIEDELARVYAVGELNRVDLLRTVSQARDKGLTQTQIANRLSISQPEVHRILRKVHNFPDLLVLNPREIILRFHAGRISHDEMMNQLIGWTYTFARAAEPANPESVMIPGTWDQLADAVYRDLLSARDYEHLVAASGPARRSA